MVDHEEEDLRTEYERQRAAHVARNREYMARLGVLSAVAAVQPKPKPNNKKRNQTKVKVKVEVEVERRRSGRLRGAKVEYTMEDLKDDVEDGARKRRRREGGACRRQNDDDDDEAGERRRREEEAMRAWLAESREAMISRRVEPEDAGGWRAEAVRRWGEGVAAAEAGTGAVCWETFVRTRLSRPPPPSPHALLQEFYAHDPWRLLSCCVLMSRVSSWETKHFCISEFFKAFPTPSDFSPQAEDPSLVRDVIRPLGLFDNRFKALVALTSRFLTCESFDVGLDKHNKVYGVGAFGVDSYEVFCKGETKGLDKGAEKALRTYCAWRNSL